jgi:hypothetical protein
MSLIATPTSDPLPDAIARTVGGLVGLPGCAAPTPRELAEMGEWMAADRQQMERGDVHPYHKPARMPESFQEVRV